MAGLRSAVIAAASRTPAAMAHGAGALYLVSGIFLVLGLAAIALGIWGGRGRGGRRGRRRR